MKIIDKIINLLGKNAKSIVQPIVQSVEIEISEAKAVEKKSGKKRQQLPKTSEKSRPLVAPLAFNIKSLPFDFCVKNLEILKESIKVQGSGREPYLVDLSQLSCTCGDFREMRSAFPINDIRRVCKHQGGVIAGSLHSDDIETDKVFKAMLRNLGGKSFQRYSAAIEVQMSKPIDGPEIFYLFKETGRDWVDVLILDGDLLGKYGFNVNKKQWAGKRNPFPPGSKGQYTKAMKAAFEKMA